MVKQVAKKLDPQRFGVKAFYVFGSTKNATAGPQSDIDVLIHFNGTTRQRKDLWLFFFHPIKQFFMAINITV